MVLLTSASLLNWLRNSGLKSESGSLRFEVYVLKCRLSAIYSFLQGCAVEWLLYFWFVPWSLFYRKLNRASQKVPLNAPYQRIKKRRWYYCLSLCLREMCPTGELKKLRCFHYVGISLRTNNQPKFSYGLPLLWGGTLSSCPLYAASEISSKLIILIHLGLTQISSCHCFQISVIIHFVRL